MENEQNYAASDRILGDAVDQAVREETPAGLTWVNSTTPRLVEQRLTSALDLPGGLTIRINQTHDNKFWASACVIAQIGNMSMEEAQIASIPTLAIKLETALAELREHAAPASLARCDGQTRLAAVKIPLSSIMASLAADGSDEEDAS